MMCTIANSLWMAGCASDLARFHYATSRVAEEQEQILKGILAANAGTAFGESHGFSSIRNVREYQQRVPLSDFERHEPWIDRSASGVPNLLTRERVRLFEPTSGSSGPTKLVPYTPSLLREFQRGIRPWIADLFAHDPALMGGPAYWSVSPVNRDLRQTSGGIPIGFDDDTAYVGGWQRRLVNAVMAVPDSVRLVDDVEAFRDATLQALVRCRNLRLISVWNPTYLLLLLERLSVRSGSLAETCMRLWPKLRVISCWKDANAAGPAAKLAALFPQARIQGKGLIATEAFVSFPLSGLEHAALAIRSHFLEFLPVDSDRPLLAHQLERGGLYTVVVTTGGGLYRYQLGDLIEVTGHLRDCPLLRFVGRQGYVSDWFGEKLNEAHVSRVLENVFHSTDLVPSFAMLACETDSPPGYVLYIDSSAEDECIHRAAELVDAHLRENFHYDYARRLGQLACVRVARVRNGAQSYLAAAIERGQNMGDVKLPALDRRNGWAEVFSV